MKKTGAITFLFFLLLTACNRFAREDKVAAAASIGDLLEGNKRFASHHPLHPHESLEWREEIAAAQHPVTAIICCSDSRVPPEIIFDQGLGDMFVVRTAGNLMGGLEIGSIEYAVEHLGVKQVIVMGHKECGAIKAFAAGGETPGHIKDIVDSLKAEEEIRLVTAVKKDILDQCVRANIIHGIRQLKAQSALIADRIHKNELQIVGACYDINKGLVELIFR